MDVFWFLQALYINLQKESCTTPSGEQGVCVPIRWCPLLLSQFANYDINPRLLTKFICSNGNLGLFVCCRETNELEFQNKRNLNLKFENTENCGISSNLKNENGIIPLDNFPWLVKIMAVSNQYLNVKERGPEKVGCTGVLITTLYVLYSAQCHVSVLISEGPRIFVRIDSNIGEEDKCNKLSYAPDCRKSQSFEINAFEVHPFYDIKTKVNDIAMLMLSRPVPDTDFSRPICLPAFGETVKVGDTLYTVGWNRTYKFNDTSVKSSQLSVLISNGDCMNRLQGSGSNISVSSYEMCTDNKNKSDNSDIGLPLISLRGNRWYLQGFESQGNNVKIHTRVQSYVQWILARIISGSCPIPYNNQIGKCVPLSSCPSLYNAFTNPEPKDEKGLSRFKCWFTHEGSHNPLYSSKVCCGLTSNFTIPFAIDENHLDFKVSDFRYCGLQHRDDYLSTDDSIAIDEYPWLAIILNATLQEQKDKVCGGTLITARYVLTSGQCTYWFKPDDVMLVRLGDYNLKNSRDCVKLAQFDSFDCNDIQEYGIEKKIVHPFFDRGTLYNDIALLRLNMTVAFNDYVRPICLPRTESDLAHPGDTLFFTGFGNINRYGKTIEIKKKVKTTLISNEVCEEKLNKIYYFYSLTEYQMCTEDFKNSTDISCIGDEGGPVMYSKKFRWFIEGISSTLGCGAVDQPQSHLKVYKYMKWIKTNIA